MQEPGPGIVRVAHSPVNGSFNFPRTPTKCYFPVVSSLPMALFVSRAGMNDVAEYQVGIDHKTSPQADIGSMQSKFSNLLAETETAGHYVLLELWPGMVLEWRGQNKSGLSARLPA
jgi:hypothetical protein